MSALRNSFQDFRFQPLQDPKLSPGHGLYLGLIQAGGTEANPKRIDSAAKYAHDFGIATECGMARCRTPELVRTLLKIHAEASAEPPARAQPARL